jgi:hypothetical protein
VSTLTIVKVRWGGFFLNKKEQEFPFATHAEAVAFIGGLRVADEHTKGDLFDCLLIPPGYKDD